MPRTVWQHCNEAKKHANKLGKVRFPLHYSKGPAERKEEMLKMDEVIMIMEEELDNQPEARKKTRRACNNMKSSLEEYIDAIQEEAFYFGYITALKRMGQEKGGVLA